MEDPEDDAETWGWEDDLPDLTDLWEDSDEDSDDEENDRETNDSTHEEQTEIEDVPETALTAAGAGVTTEWDLYDTGASKHMSARREEFINYIPTDPRPNRAPDNNGPLMLGRR